MIKIIIIPTLLLIISGCTLLENKENKSNIVSMSQSEEKIIQNNITNDNTEIYKNEKNGISFQYPKTLGKLWENKSNENEIFAIKFLDKDNTAIGLDISPAQYKELRTCDDILLKGFNDGDRIPKKCESLNIDNHIILMLTYIKHGKSNGYTSASQEIHFQTKNGVWSINASQDNLYDEAITIGKSIKYLY